MLFVAVLAAPAVAQQPNDESVTDITNEDTGRLTAGSIKSLKQKQPHRSSYFSTETADKSARFTILPVISIPMGDVSSFMGPGFGAALRYDASILPWSGLQGLNLFDLRGGVMGSYTSHGYENKEFLATTSFINADVFISTDFIISSSFNVYAGIGAGVSNTTVNKTFKESVTGTGEIEGKTFSGSSFDGVAVAHTGLRYRFSQSFSAGIDGAYQLVFQSVTGNFVIAGFYGVFHL